MHNDQRSDFVTRPNPLEIARLLVEDREGLYKRVRRLSPRMLRRRFSTESLLTQVAARAKVLEAVESFLMTYREDLEASEFFEMARTLARETFAYSLATPEEREWLGEVFLVAKRIERDVPEPTQQKRYGRTLLGVDTSLAIDAWAKQNLSKVEACQDEEDLFELLWPLLLQLASEKRLKDTEPPEALLDLARTWLSGHSYNALWRPRGIRSAFSAWPPATRL
jgi:hypothetical protein